MIEIEKYSSGQMELDTTGYKFFHPSFINDSWKWDDSLINKLLEKAAIKLGELNSFSKLVPNIDLFIQLHIAKEAVLSSRIEGTKTQMDEALLNEEDVLPERRDDWKEVNNYIKALNTAIKELEMLPISSRMIKKTHALLLDNVRGKHKQPGEFRVSQNWIGGNSLVDATFIPPHHQYINELMGDLEKFIHNEEIHVPALIKIAIIHYQFETIHPFLDGNGRIGRLLIPLFLIDQKILHQPLLYLSTYFEKNKGLYYDNLTFVRFKNDMTQWLKYFLTGIAETAEDATQTLSKILELKVVLEKKINNTLGRKSHNATHLLSHLFENPIISPRKVEEITQMTYKSANDLVKDFESLGILKEMTGKTRKRMYEFTDYLKLFNP